MPLNLPGSVHVAPDREQLFDDLAAIFMSAAFQALREREVFHVALSGGSTPEPFYMKLVTDVRYRWFPWDRSHVWIVDERRVPEDDERSNFCMMRESLLDHVTMSRRQLHPMPVMSEDPAGQYEAELLDVMRDDNRGEDGVPRLDFVLLGMGDDAHTASLFPHSPALSERDRLIATNDGEHVTPPPRVTMTYPLLNAARRLVVLATGEKKTATLKRVAEQVGDGGPDPANMPITGICPADGSLTWYLDAAASGA